VTDVARQPLFLFGAARTGTTLLQRLLNSYDDVLVWGEHAGMLEGVAEGFYRGWDDPNLFRDPRPLASILADSDPEERWQGWMSWYTRDDWRDAFRGLVERLLLPEGLPGKRVWGFKEIRYLVRPTDRTLDFLHELYPDAVFVFIARDAFNAIASTRRMATGAHTLVELKALCDRWTARYRAYRDWHRSGRVRSFWIRYEDLIEGRGELQALLGYLGKSFGDRQREVLAAEGGRGSSFRDEGFNERWRRLPAAWIGVVHACVGGLNAELGYTGSGPSAGRRLLGRALLAGLTLRGFFVDGLPAGGAPLEPTAG
jgi:sulfotransferase family protein